jgi:hypothetical protein
MVQDTSERRPGCARAAAWPGRLGVTQGSAATAGATVSQSQPGLHWQGVFHNQLGAIAEPTVGIREIQVDVLVRTRASDVMARAGGAADVQKVPCNASVVFIGYLLLY